MARHLLVAHQTVDSEELMEAALGLTVSDPLAEFTVLVPATPVRHMLIWEEGETLEAAKRRANYAAERLAKAGCNVVDARIGDQDPVLAVEDELRRSAYQTILISTFPERRSRWLRLGAIPRLRQLFPQHHLIHVVARSETASQPGSGQARHGLKAEGDHIA